jgi:hypothetical protein
VHLQSTGTGTGGAACFLLALALFTACFALWQRRWLVAGGS